MRNCHAGTQCGRSGLLAARQAVRYQVLVEPVIDVHMPADLGEQLISIGNIETETDVLRQQVFCDRVHIDLVLLQDRDRRHWT